MNNSLNSTINLLILAQNLMKNLLILIIPIAYRPVSSADQQVIGAIRWEPPFISVSSSWANDTSRRLHTSHREVGIQTLVRVGGNESIEGARGGGRTRLTSRFSPKQSYSHQKMPAKTYRPTHLKWPPGSKRLTWATPSI